MVILDRLFRWLLERHIRKLDDAHGYFFTHDGKVAYCGRCGKACAMPRVLIPVALVTDPDGPRDPGGRPYEHTLKYHGYHFGCAVREILSGKHAGMFIPKSPEGERE